MPIILALVLNEIRCKWFKKVTQTLLYLPHFLSWVIIGGLGYQLFSMSTGVVNILIENAGGSPIPFLQDDVWWVITYVLIGVWQSMGWGTIIYLAAITGVNPELYEAARVDGAGRWKQCWHVTLPGIRSAIVTLLIMNLGRVMQGSFERIFALMNAKATEFTTTIPVLVYRWGIEGGKFSEATALGLFQSVIGLILALAADFVAKRMGDGNIPIAVKATVTTTDTYRERMIDESANTFLYASRLNPFGNNTTLLAITYALVGGVGVLSILLSFCILLYSICSFIFKWNNLTAGWTSIMVSITFFAGVQLFALWIMSEYVSRIYDESKGRPEYIIKEKINIEK